LQITQFKKYIFLHLCILIYSVTSGLSKYASGFAFFSFSYIFLLCIIVFILGIHALLWQQLIKYFQPSVAYSNKSVSLIWSLLMSVFIFGEKLTFFNLIGAVMIVLGVILVAAHE